MRVLHEIKVPQESINDKFLSVVALLFNNGDQVKKNDIVLELETSKAVVTLETEQDGYIEYYCKVDDDVNVNTTVVKIWDEIIASPIRVDPIVQKKIKDDSETDKIQYNFNGKFDTVFSSKALQLISENNLSKDMFKQIDFVNDTVIKNYLNPNVLSNKTSLSNKDIKYDSIENQNYDLDKVTLHKISHFKKREIEYLSDVQSAGLVSVIYIELDAENIFDSVNDNLKYFKNSILPIIIYECSRLLVKYPIFNSYYSNQGIAIYNDIHIGIAMDIDDGLKVVKIANTNKLQFNDLEEKLFVLANKYLEKKLETEDLVDVTFTITDLSSFGAYSFSPLINRNNSAILGISKIDDKLNRIILSLAFDHRVTDGKTAAIFMQDLKSRFESYCFNVKTVSSIKNISCCKCLKTLEQDLNDTGFIKIVNKNGEDKYICDLCLLNI